MLFHTPFVDLLNVHIGPIDVQKQISVLDLRGTLCTIAGLPKDPSHTSVGLPRGVHSMIVLKWWICKFHYFLVKILKILIGPNENLNWEKLINRFWANLNCSQFAFVTKMNEDSWYWHEENNTVCEKWSFFFSNKRQSRKTMSMRVLRLSSIYM